jgi:hypothetical protein
VVRAPTARFAEPDAAALVHALRAARLRARQRQHGFDRQGFEVLARGRPAGVLEQAEQGEVLPARVGGVGAHGRRALAFGELSKRRGALAGDLRHEVRQADRVAPAFRPRAGEHRLDGEPVSRRQRLIGVRVLAFEDCGVRADRGPPARDTGVGP